MNNLVIVIKSLQQEISSMAQHSFDDGREQLNDLEIEHLIKMTNNVLAKIKQQIMEIQ